MIIREKWNGLYKSVMSSVIPLNSKESLVRDIELIFEDCYCAIMTHLFH